MHWTHKPVSSDVFGLPMTSVFLVLPKAAVLFIELADFLKEHVEKSFISVRRKLRFGGDCLLFPIDCMKLVL